MNVLNGILAGVFTLHSINKNLKKNKQAKSTEGLRVAHNSPGRLRIYAAKLKQPDTANALRIQLIRIEGIQQVSVTEETGSALVLYNPERLEADLIIAVLFKLLSLDPVLPPEKASLIAKEVQLVGKSLNYALLDKSKGLLDVKTLLPIMFTGLAFKEILRTGTLGTPSPLTLLYWSYNLFELGGHQNDA